jgi:hypothetical protein
VKSTVQRFKFIGITILSILLLTIVGATFLSPAHAFPTITLNISPNPPLPNQPVTFSGQVSSPATSADSMAVYVHSGSLTCPDDIGFVALAVNLVPSFNPALKFTGTADSSGFYSITVPGGFAVGQYGAIVIDASAQLSSLCDPFTVAPPIPEYPVGLAVLALLMVLSYAVIRRRTRT